jgi:hypothetical protein
VTSSPRPLPDDHVLYRRVPSRFNPNLLVFDQELALWRATSASIVFDPDGSVYCREFLEEGGLTWRSLPQGPEAVFYEFLAGEARTYFPRVEHSPYPRGYVADEPWEAAHCSLWPDGMKPKDAKRAARALARQSRFVNLDASSGDFTEPATS